MTAASSAISRTWPRQPACSRISRRRCASAVTTPSLPPTPPRAVRCTSRSPRGACSLCHAPHGSAVKKLLLASPGRELCLKCHKDPALDPGGTAWAVPHPALDDGCPTCHRPHVAEAPRLLAKPQRALCAGCHEDKNLNGDGVAVVSAARPRCHRDVRVLSRCARGPAEGVAEEIRVRNLRNLPHRSARAPSGGRTRPDHRTARERQGPAAARVPGQEKGRQARVRRVSSTARLGQSAHVEPRTWRVSAPAVTRCERPGPTRGRLTLQRTASSPGRPPAPRAGRRGGGRSARAAPR